MIWLGVNTDAQRKDTLSKFTRPLGEEAGKADLEATVRNEG